MCFRTSWDPTSKVTGLYFRSPQVKRASHHALVEQCLTASPFLLPLPWDCEAIGHSYAVKICPLPVAFTWSANCIRKQLRTNIHLSETVFHFALKFGILRVTLKQGHGVQKQTRCLFVCCLQHLFHWLFKGCVLHVLKDTSCWSNWEKILFSHS
jgi:hypothetical protein